MNTDTYIRNTWALPVCQAGSSHTDRTEFSSQHPPPTKALPCYCLLLLKARIPSTPLVENWYSRKVTNGSGTGLAFLVFLCDWLHSGQSYSADVMLTASKDWVLGFPINSESTQAEHFLGCNASLPADRLLLEGGMQIPFAMGFWHLEIPGLWLKKGMKT